MTVRMTPKQQVFSIFRDFLLNAGTKECLLALISRAEETEAFTWGQSLWLNLLDTPISNQPRHEAESDEQYVNRSIKYLLSKESQNTAIVLGNLLDEFENERNVNHAMEATLISILSRQKL